MFILIFFKLTTALTVILTVSMVTSFSSTKDLTSVTSQLIDALSTLVNAFAIRRPFLMFADLGFVPIAALNDFSTARKEEQSVGIVVSSSALFILCLLREVAVVVDKPLPVISSIIAATLSVSADRLSASCSSSCIFFKSASAVAAWSANDAVVPVVVSIPCSIIDTGYCPVVSFPCPSIGTGYCPVVSFP